MKKIFLLFIVTILTLFVSPILGQRAINTLNSNFLTHGDFIYCGAPNYGLTNQLTVSAWVKWTTDPKTFAVTPANHEREGQYSTYISYSGHNNTDVTTENLQFTLRNEKTNAFFQFIVKNTSGTEGKATSKTAASVNTWYFITGVYNGATVKIYVNGVEEGSANLTGNVKTNDGTHRLNMGRLPWGYGFFVGYMDEVRIWNYALSPAEITTQMGQSGTVQPTYLKSYWNFEEGSGTAINDQGSVNADGVFYSALIDVHTIQTSPYRITDNDKTWTVNYWQGCTIKTVSGAGIDETNVVASNTAIEITFQNAWITTPIADGTANMTWYGVQKSVPTNETTQWVISDAPFPVELTSFSAKPFEQKVLLEWHTATEINNHHFEIEKATGENWSKIGEVPGHGNSNSPKEYSFVDSKISSGKYSYRLKQIDTDGTFSYSATVYITIDQIPADFNLSQNYPNPFNPSTVISYQLPLSSSVTLKLFDVLGNEVAEFVNEDQEAGYYNYPLSIINYQLSSGVYYYQLRAGDFVSTKKMILMK